MKCVTHNIGRDTELQESKGLHKLLTGSNINQSSFKILESAIPRAFINPGLLYKKVKLASYEEKVNVFHPLQPGYHSWFH